jgi:hypothetical protein
VVREMRCLSEWLLEADVRQEAASLALRVCGQVREGIAEASGEVYAVMRDAMGDFCRFHPEAWRR